MEEAIAWDTVLEWLRKNTIGWKYNVSLSSDDLTVWFSIHDHKGINNSWTVVTTFLNFTWEVLSELASFVGHKG